MTLSLNEVEALAKKATRGAGYPWGIAEEAGKAVRWLCARDVDGCAALADVLAEIEGAALKDHTPRIDDIWTSRRIPARAPALLQTYEKNVHDTLAGFPELRARRLKDYER